MTSAWIAYYWLGGVTMSGLLWLARAYVRRRRARSVPRLSLRPDGKGRLDDVVVPDVACFRAERMDEDWLWLACYLENTGRANDRITFGVRARGGRLDFYVGEQPHGRVTYEDGSLTGRYAGGSG